MLTKEQLNECLRNYYLEHYGEKDTDIWFDQPAVNAWAFKRGEKYITLISHPISGEVREVIEE